MRIRSSAPGRICLFGDHQDYLGFPVIAAAIDLRINIEGSVSEGETIHLDLPDMNDALEFDSSRITYTSPKDYLKSAVNVLKKENLYVPKSIRASIQGNVPINAGTSSSAALSVSWTSFLLKASGADSLLETPSRVGEFAYRAEVEEFNESGGRMDQYSSAIGGIIYLDFYRKMTAHPLPQSIKEFVLGDSLQPKDTQKSLKRGRTGQEEAFRHLARLLDFKDNFHVSYQEAEPYFGKIPEDSLPYLQAALMNHQITDNARAELSKETPDVQRIAHLMNRHQDVLRDKLKVSTTKIDHMLDMSMKAGALAGKINGSGEGGCMFAFCPGKQQEVAEAIEKAGGVPYIINIGNGLSVETL
jgi:galactokinase